MTTELAAYLDRLVEVTRRILTEDLVGVYAAGSVALHAYTPGRSDVDVAVVCESALPSVTKQRLVNSLRHVALPCPARGLELVAYRRSVAASGTPEPGFECELNDGERMPFRSTYDPADRPLADGLFWYGLDRSILHQTGRALFGPPAAEVFGDLRPSDLRQLMITALRWWMQTTSSVVDGPASGADDAVLGACRSLVRCREGIWVAKVDAGRRLIRQGWSPQLIEQAIAARRGGPPPDQLSARAFQQAVLDEIMAA